MAGYTVVDVETTGYSPAHHDRVVEIALVHVSERGEIQEQWSTLVDPGRDIGPTQVHGLTASDVLDAPTFTDIAPYVLRECVDSVLVAHNAPFDLRFLAHELEHAGIALNQLPLTGVCTMHWAPAFLTSPSRRLGDCCASAGITLDNAHSAAADALATAQLLSHYLRACDYRPPWSEMVSDARTYPWPTLNGSYPPFQPVRRGTRSRRRDGRWLESLVARLPQAADPQVDSYLAVLEEAMVDHFLAEHEKAALLACAADAGLSRGQVLDLHGTYLDTLAQTAWADGVVTAEERRLLEQVAGSLGLTAADVTAALQTAEQSAASSSAPGQLSASGISLRPGDRVTFTGAMQRGRSEWRELAAARGLVPGGVTKRTALVVAADPNSASGKAATARSYGIPIITEEAFERLLLDS